MAQLPADIESIWLTPLLSDQVIIDAIPRLGTRQFLVIGTEDQHYYKPDALASFPRSVQILVQPGANHGLDLEGDALKSIDIMKELMEQIVSFIAR